MDRDELMTTVGRIEAKLDNVLAGQSQLTERVSRLEKWQNRMAGGMAAITALFAIVVAAVKGWTPHGG